MATFSKLQPGEQAALMLISRAVHNKDLDENSLVEMKSLYRHKDWGGLSAVARVSSKNAPHKSDFEQIGSMSSGLRDAQYFLCMLDIAPADATEKIKSFFDTFCWEKIHEGLQESLSKMGISFTAEDLHTAYAPGNNSPCNSPNPSNLAKLMMGTIAAEQVLQGFFSQSVPDFFKGDFSNFFAGSIPDFFTGEFSDFFKNIGNGFTGAMTDVGDTMKGVGEGIGDGVTQVADDVAHGAEDFAGKVGSIFGL